MALRLGRLELGAVPRIAVPLSDVELRPHGERVRRLADVVELRIDHFATRTPAAVDAAAREARQLGLPLIATVRAAAEGGAAGLDDEQRWALYDAAAPLVDALDVELHASIRERVVALAKRHRALAIVSHHDFAATPDAAALELLTTTAARSGADVVKIAAHAAAAADLGRLCDVLRARCDGSAIVIAMGPGGAASRVFFPLLGSLITYGFAAAANAPGQLALEELYDALRRYSPAFAAARPARAA